MSTRRSSPFTQAKDASSDTAGDATEWNEDKTNQRRESFTAEHCCVLRMIKTFNANTIHNMIYITLVITNEF